MLPVFDSPVFKTSGGTSYLKGPGVALLAMPYMELNVIEGFLAGFPKDLEFSEYLADPTDLDAGEELVKFAGQLCYLALGPKRTPNAKAKNYLDHIKESGHGSVLEHCTYSFLIYGIDRSVTHELVRHRAGAAYSQVSQRYVDGSILRFVERPEFQNDKVLHETFESWIDKAVQEYNWRAGVLMDKQTAGDPLMSADRKTDLRKKVNQAARSCLPNETEAPIVVSLNVRSLRHVLEMRASPTADTQIRAMAMKMYQCVKQVSPLLFDDYRVETLPDGTEGLTTKWRKA